MDIIYYKYKHDIANEFINQNNIYCLHYIAVIIDNICFLKIGNIYKQMNICKSNGVKTSMRYADNKLGEKEKHANGIYSRAFLVHCVVTLFKVHVIFTYLNAIQKLFYIITGLIYSSIRSWQLPLQKVIVLN